jgi:hypothetical protein
MLPYGVIVISSLPFFCLSDERKEKKNVFASFGGEGACSAKMSPFYECAQNYVHSYVCIYLFCCFANILNGKFFQRFSVPTIKMVLAMRDTYVHMYIVM